MRRHVDHEPNVGPGHGFWILTGLCLVLAPGCETTTEPAGDDDDTQAGDLDGDGYTTSEGDCDDADATVHPGAIELCDGLDNDCDGMVSNEETDDDADGFDECAGDCDDTAPATFPGAAEVCDGEDNDCDGLVPGDETDDDGDGASECGQGDCDDGDSTTHPGAVELCDGLDNDCDGVVPDEEIDDDGDGYLSCGGVDCDDGDAASYPGAVELCDGIDNDCDGGLPTDETDDDGDGFVECGGDCDDADPSIYPGAVEICDNADSDCDGFTPAEEADDDGDGYDECGGGDCDDGDALTYPGAAELCDGLDNDCDGLVPLDETDDDGDGFDECSGGDCDDESVDSYPGAVELCDGEDNDCDGVVPADETDDDGDGFDECNDGDCDDTHATVFPGAPEVCDGLDNDCDVATDELMDHDGDGFTECDGDCDDLHADAYPGNTELECDGLDNDCDPATVDDLDVDGDGYGFCDDCDDGNPEIHPGYTGWETHGVDGNCDGVFGMVLSGADEALLGQCDSYSGNAVAGVGDANGDGLDDFLVGASNWAAYGVACLGLGRTTAFPSHLSLLSPCFSGMGSDDSAGIAVSGAGDVNGDGRDDLLIAAMGSFWGGAGKVHLVYGRTNGWPALSSSDGLFLSEDLGAFDYGDLSLSDAGDVNGDGYDDFMVGRVTDNRIWLIYGRTGGWPGNLAGADVILDGVADECIGGAFDGVGDIDGDGFDDLVVGGPCNDDVETNLGKTYILYGRASGWPTETTGADVSIDGEFAGDYSSGDVAGLGDVNGDGIPDVLTTALGNEENGENAGKAHIVFGRLSGWPATLAQSDVSFFGEPGEHHGIYTAAAAGDVNGDGLADMLFGASQNNQYTGEAGKVWLVLGRSTGWPAELAYADAAFVGEAYEDKAGWSVAGAGDVDGDGRDDILIGAIQHDAQCDNVGKTYLLFWPF